MHFSSPTNNDKRSPHIWTQRATISCESLRYSLCFRHATFLYARGRGNGREINEIILVTDALQLSPPSPPSVCTYVPQRVLIQHNISGIWVGAHAPALYHRNTMRQTNLSPVNWFNKESGTVVPFWPITVDFRLYIFQYSTDLGYYNNLKASKSKEALSIQGYERPPALHFLFTDSKWHTTQIILFLKNWTLTCFF